MGVQRFSVLVGCVVLCFWLDGYCFDFYFLVFIVHRILADAFASLRAWRFVGGRSLGAVWVCGG